MGEGARVEFARRLREARGAAGLSLRALSRKSGYSLAALSEAESGRRTPSWPLVEAYLQSCEQEPAHWRQLWEVARADKSSADLPAAETPPAESGDDQVTPPAGPAPSLPDAGTRKRSTVGIRAACFAAGAVVGGAATFLVSWQVLPRSPAAAVKPAQPAGRAASRDAHDGADPYASGCWPDRKALDSTPMTRPGGGRFGTLVLYYSRTCQAEWGVVEGPNSPQWTIHIVARRLGDGVSAPSQFHGATPEPFSWGNVLMVRTGCVQAEAWVTDRRGSGADALTACMQGG